jgi:hypothetical protein
MTLWPALRNALCVVGFLAAAQVSAQAPVQASPAPLAGAGTLRLAGAQKFRAVMEIRNTGAVAERDFRNAMLVADGSVTAEAAGFVWRFELSRLAVDNVTLADKTPLAEVVLLTDEGWELLASRRSIAPKAYEDPVDRRLRDLVQIATEFLGNGFGILPDGPVKQGSSLMGLDAPVRSLLAWGWQNLQLKSFGPVLRVMGSGTQGGRRTVAASGSGPVTWITPLGSAGLDVVVQAEIAVDSGLPLLTVVRLSGELPGGIGRVDTSMRCQLRPL